MDNILSRNWWALALRGAVAVLFGLAAIVMPAAALVALLYIFAVYLVVDGVLAITAGIRAAERHQRWGMLIAEGVLDLAAAVVIVAQPGLSLLVFVYVAGFWAIVSGAALLVAALRLHRQHGEWLLVPAGLLSVIWGVLVVIWPAVGIVAWAWWIGIYALIFGGLMLAAAFRLRKAQA